MLDYNKHVGFDFETEPITDQTPLPKPIALAIKTGDSKRAYLDLRDPKNVEVFKSLYEGWVKDGKSLIGHNTIFDIMIADTYFDWFSYKDIKWHCTMVLAWLVNPELNPKALGLKSLSQSWLGDPPEEQQLLFDWLRGNQSSFAHKYTDCTKDGTALFNKDDEGNPILKNKTFVSWGAFICEAPRSLLEGYALSDVDKTLELFNHIFSNTFFSNPSDRKDIWGSYERELEVQRILYERTRKGVRIDLDLMNNDLSNLNTWIGELETYLLGDLGIEKINSGKQLSVALVEKGFVKSWSDYVEFSEKEKFSDGRPLPKTGTESLEKATDHIIVQDIKLLKRLYKFRSTYILGWFDRAKGDRLHFSFFTMLNTGRISAGTLGNIPSKDKADEVINCSPQFKHFKLRSPREYIIPEDGKIIITSDYSAQESRLMLQYIGGQAAKDLWDNPDTDFHQWTKELLMDKYRVDLTRKQVKAINFGIVYGKGDWRLSQDLGVTLEEGLKMKEQYLALFDGYAPWEWLVKDRLTKGNAVHTIARRKFFKRVALYIYINRLIQGSASDQLKASMVKYTNHPDRKGELYFPLHDEEVFMVEPEHVEHEIKIIIECMTECGIKLDVPFKVDVEIKEKNYAY